MRLFRVLIRLQPVGQQRGAVLGGGGCVGVGEGGQRLADRGGGRLAHRLRGGPAAVQGWGLQLLRGIAVRQVAGADGGRAAGFGVLELTGGHQAQVHVVGRIGAAAVARSRGGMRVVAGP